jgi:excisionase family DNA binding protein
MERAASILDVSQKTIYREIAAGNLVAVKYGRKVLITDDSLRARAASLPRAMIRQDAHKVAA